jgi:hypothetical protein
LTFERWKTEKQNQIGYIETPYHSSQQPNTGNVVAY